MQFVAAVAIAIRNTMTTKIMARESRELAQMNGGDGRNLYSRDPRVHSEPREERLYQRNYRLERFRMEASRSAGGDSL